LPFSIGADWPIKALYCDATANLLYIVDQFIIVGSVSTRGAELTAAETDIDPGKLLKGLYLVTVQTRTSSATVKLVIK
jgi:hypothetical protein